jgi:hypothetical protein
MAFGVPATRTPNADNIGQTRRMDSEVKRTPYRAVNADIRLKRVTFFEDFANVGVGCRPQSVECQRIRHVG